MGLRAGMAGNVQAGTRHGQHWWHWEEQLQDKCFPWENNPDFCGVFSHLAPQAEWAKL